MTVCIDVREGMCMPQVCFPTTPAVLGQSQLTLTPTVPREGREEGKSKEAEPRIREPEEMGGRPMSRLPHCYQSSEEEGAVYTPRSVFQNCSALAAFTSITHLLSS